MIRSQRESQLESILFVSSKPLRWKFLTKLLGFEHKELLEDAQKLECQYRQEKSGIELVMNDEEIQMVSAPRNVGVVKAFFRDDLTGELTRPSLETLTIISYRGPITKADLEKIRGVNCSLILHHLLLRGLIVEEENKKIFQTQYQVSVDFLKFLGISRIEELPHFLELSNDEIIQELLKNSSDPIS